MDHTRDKVDMSPQCHTGTSSSCTRTLIETKVVAYLKVKDTKNVSACERGTSCHWFALECAVTFWMARRPCKCHSNPTQTPINNHYQHTVCAPPDRILPATLSGKTFGYILGFLCCSKIRYSISMCVPAIWGPHL